MEGEDSGINMDFFQPVFMTGVQDCGNCPRTQVSEVVTVIRNTKYNAELAGYNVL